MKTYHVHPAANPVILNADFETDPQWAAAETASIDQLLRNDSDYVSAPEVKLLYDREAIYGQFRVRDRYVRAIRTGYHQSVCKDSCVEFFVKPQTDERYFNFEFSANGAMLLYHVRHCRSGDFEPVPEADCRTIQRAHSLPDKVDPEITEPVVWTLGFRIPLAFFVKYSGISPELAGQVWTCNFSKCSDESSHPHWLTWSPVSKFDFHLPECFGKLVFLP